MRWLLSGATDEGGNVGACRYVLSNSVKGVSKLLIRLSSNPKVVVDNFLRIWHFEFFE
jgi:hypothetical protein